MMVGSDVDPDDEVINDDVVKGTMKELRMLVRLCLLA